MRPNPVYQPQPDQRYQIDWVLIKFQDYGLAAPYTVLTFCVRMVGGGGNNRRLPDHSVFAIAPAYE